MLFSWLRRVSLFICDLYFVSILLDYLYADVRSLRTDDMGSPITSIEPKKKNTACAMEFLYYLPGR
jgi:hypothetical protein